MHERGKNLAIRKSNYESYDYREFWEDNKRIYEDKSERLALKKLMAGLKIDSRIFLDIGCGYGRLFNEYMNFKNIIMVDYSLKGLKTARDNIRKFLANDKQKLSSVYFIAADATSLPFKSDCIDFLLTVRVIHHLNSPEKYFNEVCRILKNEGLYFLEFANKRNLKNILRYFIGKMDTSPFNLIPSQIGETILNFHPKYITSFLHERNFIIKRLISVSNFRSELLKKCISTKLLLLFENMYQNFFSSISIGPSIFLKSVLYKKEAGKNFYKFIGSKINSSNVLSNDNARKSLLKKYLKINICDILICPCCKKENLLFEKSKIFCTSCKKIFSIEDGIYNFKK